MQGKCGCGGGNAGGCGGASASGGNGGETLIFTCAGAAHAGQVANRAGVDLAKEQVGKLFCVAAMAAGIPEKLERARKAKARVGIDGCNDRCVEKIMAKAGLPLDVHVVVTDLGIPKQPTQPDMAGDAAKVVDHMKKAVSELPS